jgi:hypothetical protein
MLYKLTYPIYRLFKRCPLALPILLLAIFLSAFGSLIFAKIYQRWDKDPDRGAIAFTGGAFGESYATPRYLDQGWRTFDSLWFYNTSQGSGLMPYDLFLKLKQADKDELFRSDANFDKYRYLPQKKTFFNPDGLAVGFVKTTYRGKDYIGHTCAACHTGQINFTEKGSSTAKAIRIDGGPAMADMVGFLTALQAALESTLKDDAKLKAFADEVLSLKNDYRDAAQVLADLKKWTNSVQRYNLINHSDVKYGHARLDAFGRIYNRVAQYAISADQLKKLLKLAAAKRETNEQQFLLTSAEVDKVMEGIGDRIVLSDDEFSLVIERLMLPKDQGYPGLSLQDLLDRKDMIFNRPDAPVSYPFLWDISHSDFLQWNGLAPNAGPGPLGRNTGEVIGVFGILDWGVVDSWWKHPLTMLWQNLSLSSIASGQKNKKKVIGFDSSINTFNLYRLESLLRNLQSPEWPFCKTPQGDYFIPEPTTKRYLVPSDPDYCQGKGARFDEVKRRLGELIYIDRCRGCHTVVDRSAWDRVVVAHMSDAKRIGTDEKMAHNAVHRTGKSGNFTDVYQETTVGNVIVAEDAPVVQILTAATKGVIATPDADKWWPRRMVEWIYTLVMSFADNPIHKSIKNGDYDPDTTAEPYASLGAYKGRSLNGIWATAPYLHNGSVPSLRELLRRPKDRIPSFSVGAREFDPVDVGFANKGTDFGKVTDPGNSNLGHDYFCKRKPKEAVTEKSLGVQRPGAVKDDEEFDCMDDKKIDYLMEYLKSL